MFISFCDEIHVSKQNIAPDETTQNSGVTSGPILFAYVV